MKIVTPVLLEVQSEGSYLVMGDLEHVKAFPLRREEILEVVHAMGDDSRGVGAFAFGGGAELITMK